MSSDFRACARCGDTGGHHFSWCTDRGVAADVTRVPHGGEDELRRGIRVALLNVLIRSHPDSGALAQHAADALLPIVLADRERHARQRAAEEKLPPVGLRPRWLANEMRAAEITAAVGRYEAAGADVPAEWRDELAALSTAARPADPLASLQDFLR